jgi:hypothetical protein
LTICRVAVARRVRASGLAHWFRLSYIWGSTADEDLMTPPKPPLDPSAPQSAPQSVDTAPEAEAPADDAPRPDPTRYGDWEKNGRCIDF